MYCSAYKCKVSRHTRAGGCCLPRASVALADKVSLARHDIANRGCGYLKAINRKAFNKTCQLECSLSFREVAQILTQRGYPTTAKVAWHLEKQALRKLALDPILHQIARELGLGEEKQKQKLPY